MLTKSLLLSPLAIVPSLASPFGLQKPVERAVPAACPDYLEYSETVHQPLSSGRYNLSSMRPSAECRTFAVPDVESTISRLQGEIKDPDLFRLFENAWPNTLDTTVAWKGTAAGSDEELTFVITGDINAMWLRDSANQMQSYLPLLKANSSSNSLASLYRGVINLQARYLTQFPYCNSFQPPPESGINASSNGQEDTVTPAYDPKVVFECKYELDSLAAFLEISSDYYTATQDAAFFGKYNWANAVQTILDTASAMMTPTYGPNGLPNTSPYTFQRNTPRASDTLDNNGEGNPVANGTGLIRSAFRPSDDATIYPFFIPANMMFQHYLTKTAPIAAAINKNSLSGAMTNMANGLQGSLKTYATKNHPVYGSIYAYEIDGFGSTNFMDDANVPSLLSLPFLGYLSASDSTYQNTRKFVLSTSNPYFMRGPVINAIGGPHNGPGYAWPMASIMRIFTSSDENEIYTALKEIVSSTSGLGLIHESIWTFQASRYTRSW